MKTFFLPLLFLCFSFMLSAQAEHRVAVSGKTIEFREIDRLIIVGHDEKDLKITREGGSTNEDERAKGMRKISASGKTDNTGFGLSSQGFDDKVVIDQVGKGNGTIMVFIPNNAVVKVVQSTYRGGDLEVKNFKGELDVSMHYHRVRLSNAYGPLAINTIYGGIEATFSSGPPTKDLRLHSTYGNVDLTLPKNATANLRLSTSYGSMYTDFDIDVKANMAQAGAAGQQSGEDHDHSNHGSGLTGTINGGGKLVSLNATYKNIYLRKLE